MDELTITAYDRSFAATVPRATPPRFLNLAARLRAEVPPDRTVLDIGCGDGRYLDTLGPKVVGVDGSLAAARGAGGHGSAVCADMARLPMRPGGAGGIWAAFSLIHVPLDGWPQCLQAWREALAPGGPTVTIVYDGGRDSGRHDDGRYFTFVGRAEVAQQFSSAGFRDVMVSDARDGAGRGALVVSARRRP